MESHDPVQIAQAYHRAWTSKDFDRAAELLADDLAVEVPVNDYPTAESFVTALRGFGSMVSAVSLLAAMGNDDQAMLLYDLDADRVGMLRVAEHFTMRDGKITHIRQVHDTVAVRAAGLAGDSASSGAAT